MHSSRRVENISMAPSLARPCWISVLPASNLGSRNIDGAEISNDIILNAEVTNKNDKIVVGRKGGGDPELLGGVVLLVREEIITLRCQLNAVVLVFPF